MTRTYQWEVFSKHVEQYILNKTQSKYTAGSVDLISMCMSGKYGKIICLFCILKYALRMFNDAGKEHDLEKIAHYASIMWNANQTE